ncbi:MAG: hypothetical protein KDA85_22545 [Planctomycetaceae bacterium]|nr:hypothetical protein [Planctomycetaceae bacterium]
MRITSYFRRFCMALTIGVLAQHAVQAQEPHHPRISIVHPGADALKADIESVLNLTTDAEKQEWDNVAEYINVWEAGVASDRLIRIDLLTGFSPMLYEVSVPLAEEEDRKAKLGDTFRDNMEALGYLTTRDANDFSLFTFDLEGGGQWGWLRILDTAKYGIVELTDLEAQVPLLRQLVLRKTDPATDVAELLKLSASLSAEGVNTAESAEDQQRRRTAFAELRKLSMDAIQQRPAESAEEFELRRVGLSTQLDELERLMAEARRVELAGFLDRTTGKSSLKFSAVAITGTSLEKTIQEFGQKPDAFANVAMPESSAFSLRLNHPLDEMRQKNIISLLEAIRADFDQRIGTSEKMKTAEKDALKKFLGGILELVSDGVHTGNINTFVEAIPSTEDQMTAIAAISAVNGSRLTALLPELAASGNGNQVELNVAKVGNLDVHRIRLAEGYVEMLDTIFGANQDLLIGVSDDYIWLASGEGALDQMKQMSESMGEPVASETAIHAQIRMLPWAQRFDRIAEQTTP